MKKILLFASIVLSANSFGQKMAEKYTALNVVNQDTVFRSDTIIKVIYKNKVSDTKEPAVFINGKLVDNRIITAINPHEIEKIDIEKGNIEIKNTTYTGKIIVATKATYKPKFISLNDIKLKYTNLEDKSTIFKIDGIVINDDYEKYLVDENNILKIIVDQFENEREKLSINFIDLITRSPKNIKESEAIILRGKRDFAVNNNQDQ